MKEKTKQKIIEFSFGLIGSMTTIGMIYGVRTDHIPLAFFSGWVLIYSLYGGRVFD